MVQSQVSTCFSFILVLKCPDKVLQVDPALSGLVAGPAEVMIYSLGTSRLYEQRRLSRKLRLHTAYLWLQVAESCKALDVFLRMPSHQPQPV